MEVITDLGRVSLVPRGAYDAAAVYRRLDIVEHEGSSYLVLVDGVSGVEPAEGPAYMLVAEKGGKGDTGAPGTPGVKGDTGERGETGAGVQSVERTAGDGSPGTTDTYTITLTDGSTSTFTVYNGKDGTSFTVLGRYDTLDELMAAHPAGSEGDAWAVGSAEDNDVYLWDVDAQTWRNIGSLQGPPGPAGPQGPQGEQGTLITTSLIDGWAVRKHSDGYVEMYYEQALNADLKLWTAWGNVYTISAGKLPNVPYPLQLTKKYQENVSVTTIQDAAVCLTNGRSYNDKTQSIGLLRGSFPSINLNILIKYSIYGLWK